MSYQSRSSAAALPLLHEEAGDSSELLQCYRFPYVVTSYLSRGILCIIHTHEVERCNDAQHSLSAGKSIMVSL